MRPRASPRPSPGLRMASRDAPARRRPRPDGLRRRAPVDRERPAHARHHALQAVPVPLHDGQAGDPDGVPLPRGARPALRRLPAAARDQPAPAVRQGDEDRPRRGGDVPGQRRRARRRRANGLPTPEPDRQGQRERLRRPRAAGGAVGHRARRAYAPAPAGPGGTVVQVLRGRLRGRTLTVPVPSVALNPGTPAALARFSLDIGSGAGRNPVFTSPNTCPKGGWDVVYAPTFAPPTGKVSLTDVTRCRS